MKKFANEIHRRSLWQILGIYGATSWVVIQVVAQIADSVGLPQWVEPLALVLLLLGLPIVLATAFIQHGVKKAAPEATAAPVVDGSPGTGSPVAAESELTADVAPAPQEVPPRTGHHRLFTWRNALLGGAAAFTLMGILTGAYMIMRASGIGPAGTLVAKGVLDEKSVVILADLEAADEELAKAATEALRVDLSQSEAIKLAETRVVEDALERMGREPSESLTTELATEIAEREGAAAVVTGEINRAGVGYVFSVQLMAPGTGDVLTSQRETAADSTDVIPAIDRLSKKLRERVGESFKTIRATPALEKVTTSDLEALRLFSQGQRSNGGNRLTLYEQAIARDSTFAMAWRSIGIFYRNRGLEPARMIEALTRAYEYRDRLTERERRLASADYYNLVTFELRKALLEYEALLELNPDDVSALINMGVAYSELREYERAVPLGQRVRSLRADMYNGYYNAVVGGINLGDFAAARVILDSATARFGEGRTAWAASFLESSQGNLDDAERILLARIQSSRNPGNQSFLRGDLAAMAGAQGRLADSEEYSGLAISALEEFGAIGEVLEDEIQAAWIDVAVRDEPQAGLQRINGVLERHAWDSLPPLNRPYTQLAELVARAGEPDRAEAYLTELRAEVPVEVLRGMGPAVLRAEAEIALAEGRYDVAITAFRRSDRGFCMICALSGMGLAYDRAGQRDSALAVYERYAETPFSDRFTSYTYTLGPAIGPTYERLGQLYDEAGNLEKAAEYYAKFVALWENADDELQPRVETAQARLEEIVRERG